MDFKKDALSPIEKDFFQNILRTNFDFKTVFKDKETYSAFFTLFCKASMLSNNFKTITLSTFEDKLTPSNEAFCLLCLDNAFERWRAECNAKLKQNPQHPDLVTHPSTKLTQEEKDELPVRRYTYAVEDNLKTGWSEDGKLLYTSYFDLCTSERKKDEKTERFTFALANSTYHNNKKRKRSVMDVVAEEDKQNEVAEAMRNNRMRAFPPLL